VRTRTLLLLAVACGAAILAAGVVLLWRIGAEPDTPAAHVIGAPVEIGDLTVTVEDYEESAEQGVVTLQIGGVDDPDGAAGFRLVVPERALAPAAATDAPPGPPPCAATTEAAVRCVLVFDVGTVEGSSRVLLYRRGDEQVRWLLGG
jgi:hypothetical protein